MLRSINQIQLSNLTLTFSFVSLKVIESQVKLSAIINQVLDVFPQPLPLGSQSSLQYENEANPLNGFDNTTQIEWVRVELGSVTPNLHSFL